MTKLFMGIDPGTNGGFSILSLDDMGVISVDTNQPLKDIKISGAWMIIKDAVYRGCVHAMIEHVAGFIGQSKGDKDYESGKNKAAGHLVAKLLRSYGILEGMLIASGVPYSTVNPTVWQRGMGLSSRKEGESQAQRKDRIKAKSKELHPNTKITLSTCDSLMIATYCLRVYTNSLTLKPVPMKPKRV